MSIGEYLEANILEYLNQKLAYLADNLKQAVVDRILRKDGALGIPQITKGMPKPEKEKISAFIKYGPALIKNILILSKTQFMISLLNFFVDYKVLIFLIMKHR